MLRTSLRYLHMYVEPLLLQILGYSSIGINHSHVLHIPITQAQNMGLLDFLHRKIRIYLPIQHFYTIFDILHYFRFPERWLCDEYFPSSLSSSNPSEEIPLNCLSKPSYSSFPSNPISTRWLFQNYSHALLYV